MEWNNAETSQAEKLAEEIDSFRAPRTTSIGKPVVELRMSSAASLKESLSCAIWGLPVRHLFREMQFDERRVFRWRMEHKLVQAHVLNYYCPGAVPVTRGLGRELSGMSAESCRRELMELCSQGYLIKAALGYASGERQLTDQTGTVLAELETTSDIRSDRSLCDERFVVQRRIKFDQEYRVHTLEGKVIPDLTFRRYRSDIVRTERNGPNRYVQGLLNSLPAGLLSGVMYGWDVAWSSEEGFLVIEVNPVGFHPVFEPGFQCSGYFLDPSWGPPVVAKLFRFVEEEYGAEVRVNIDDGGKAEDACVYWWVARWKELLDVAGAAASLVARVEATNKVRIRQKNHPTLPSGQASFALVLAGVHQSCEVLEEFCIPSVSPKT
jgi:hypothetical protein